MRTGFKNEVDHESDRYVKELIKKGEGQQLDFKFEISDAKKMARTFSAFANTDGGKLLIGVKDNGRISGIRSEEEAYMAESAAHVFCKPAVQYTLKKWEIEGKSVLEIEIPVSRKRPHFAKDDRGTWIAYVRVRDENIKANRIIVEVWKSQGRKKGVLLNYGKEEEALIDYLNEHGIISLSTYTRIAKTSRARAEKILARLIAIKVLDFEINDKTIYFKLNPFSN